MGNESSQPQDNQQQSQQHQITSLQMQQIYTNIIFSLSSSQKPLILARIRKRTESKLEYVQKINEFVQKQQDTICGYSYKVMIAIARPSPTLRDYIRYRRTKKRNFNLDEILSVVRSVCLGLKEIKNLGQQHGDIVMENIIVNTKITIVDPLYLEKDSQANGIRQSKRIKGFPSPQKLINYFDKLSNFEQFYADLFSLGIVALQMYFVGNDMSNLYKNKNPTYCNNSLDVSLLNSFLQLIKQPILAQIITILVHFDPKTRTNIYNIIHNITPNLNNLKILKQNPFAIKSEDYLIEPIDVLDQMSKSTNKVTKIERRDIRSDSHHSLSNNNFRLKVQNQRERVEEGPLLMRNNSVNIHQLKTNNQKQFNHQNSISSFTNPYNQSHHHQSNSTLKSPPQSYHNLNPNRNIQPSPNKYQATHYNPPVPPQIQFNKHHNISIDPHNNSKSSSNNNNNNNNNKLINQLELNPNNQSIEQQRSRTIHKKQESIVQPQQSTLNRYLPSLSVDKQYQDMEQTIKRLQQSMAQLLSTNHLLDNSVVLYDIPKSNSKAKLTETTLQAKVQLKENISQTNNTRAKYQLKPHLFNHSILEQPSLQNSFVVDSPEDYVVEEYQIGTRYEGYQRNRLRNGVGKFYYSEKSIYNGEWKDNQMNGYGVLTYESGNLAYEGYWKNDQFHGKGIIYNENPDALTGGFNYKDMNKVGDYWKMYEGELNEGKKEGHGRFTLTNGQKYQGQFLLGLVHGEGRFVCLDGREVRGLWKEGIFLDVRYFLQLPAQQR